MGMSHDLIWSITVFELSGIAFHFALSPLPIVGRAQSLANLSSIA